MVPNSAEMTNVATETRSLLLDIEGTVTPISFVHEVLFPFARAQVQDFLIQHSTDAGVQEDLQRLADENRLDQSRTSEGEKRPPRTGETLESIVAYVNWLIDLDRKSPALKSLQGKIWEEGYRNGTLKAPLFEDVVPGIERCRSAGIKIGVFSSGSVLAQKLLFAHTETGDHSDLIDEHFDTEVGSKVSSTSYQEIARRLERSPSGITFVSDVTNELKAAREAGMATLLCVRPGNPPQAERDQFRVIHSFSESLFA